MGYAQLISSSRKLGKEKLGRKAIETSTRDFFFKFMFKNLSLKEEMSFLCAQIVSNNNCESNSLILEVMG